MENCLVIKLKATVNNNSLEYLDYLHINVHQVESPDANNFSISMLTLNPTTDKMITTGDGHFTDGTMQSDLGKEAKCNGSGQKLSNGNYQLLIPLTGIVKFNSGSGTLTGSSDWQVAGLNYERMFRVNADTLTTVKIPDSEGYYEIMSYAKKITEITFLNGGNNMEKYMAAIVDATGRISSDITFAFLTGADFYSSGGAIRKIKNIVPGTSFSVYNSNGSQLLYTASKTGGTWQYTLA